MQCVRVYMCVYVCMYVCVCVCVCGVATKPRPRPRPIVPSPLPNDSLCRVPLPLPTSRCRYEWGSSKVLNELDLTTLSRSQLRNHLEARDVDASGTKNMLLERLQDSLEQERLQSIAVSECANTSVPTPVCQHQCANTSVPTPTRRPATATHHRRSPCTAPIALAPLPATLPLPAALPPLRTSPAHPAPPHPTSRVHLSTPRRSSPSSRFPKIWRSAAVSTPSARGAPAN